MPNRQKDKVVEEEKYMRNGVEVGRKQVESKRKNVVDSDGNVRTVESRKITERGDTSQPSKSLGAQIKEGANELVQGIKDALGSGNQKQERKGEVVVEETVIERK